MRNSAVAKIFSHIRRTLIQQRIFPNIKQSKRGKGV